MGDLVFEGIVQKIDAAAALADNERAAIDERWTPAAKAEKAKEIEDYRQSRIAELQAEAAALIAKQRSEIAAIDYRRRIATGPRVGEWPEAAARSGFVAAEVAKMAPHEIAAAYQQAKAAGDLVGAWLIERAGADRLDQLSAQAVQDKRLDVAANVGEARSALQAAAWGDVDRAAAEDRRRVDELQAQLSAAINRGSRPTVKIAF